MPKKIDLVGKSFGKWTVVGPSKSRKGIAMWVCHCSSCGLLKPVSSQHLRNGTSTQCRRCSASKARGLVPTMKKMRAEGRSYGFIGERLGVHPHTVLKNLGPDGQRSTWMHTYFNTVRRWRGKGMTWAQVQAKTPYSSLEALKKAFGEEYRKRRRPKHYRRAAVREWTKQGHTASAIATRLGITERSVVRIRREVEALPALDHARVVKLLERELTWADIALRLGQDPMDYRDFQARFEAEDQLLRDEF